MNEPQLTEYISEKHVVKVKNRLSFYHNNYPILNQTHSETSRAPVPTSAEEIETRRTDRHPG